MKILFSTDQTYLHGGIEKVMSTKANYLISDPKYEVIILTTEQYGRVPRYRYDAKVKHIDLNVNYNRNKSYFSLGNLCRAIKHLFKQRRIFNQIRPDIIISPNYNFDHYWLTLIKPAKSKVIKEIHASGYTTPELRKRPNVINRLKWKFNDFIMAKYDSIVVLNDDEKNYQFTTNVVVIPNPIESGKGIAELKNKLVMAAGRIAPVKGFDKLISTWKIVNQKHPEWQLHIFGESYANTKQELEVEIKALNLSNVIIFKDSVSNLPEIMLNYSFYAMTSTTECFPMVLLEAMSVGLPVISHDCPNGPRHIINHKSNGFLIEYQNIEDLAKGFTTLMENEDIRQKLGKQAKIDSTNFETKSVMLLWVKLFHELNKERR